MKYNLKPYSGPGDQPAMQALAQAHPDLHLHCIDLPYRLSSWALDDPLNIGLWEDNRGRLAGWSVMQTPFWMIDYICDPQAESELLPRILTWADERAKAIRGTPYGLPCWFISAFASQPARIAALEAIGFACQADLGEDSWSQVLMERPADEPVPAYRLPKGVTIRPLHNNEAQEYVNLHREVFETKNMTLEWRERTFQQPDYISDIDLVAEDEQGRLVAFCVCWLNEVGGAVEPLGCHADYRKNALGRTILCEGLRRLQAHGARRLFVHTDDYRNTAFDLYENVGFKVTQKALIFRKDYPSA